MPTGRPGDRAPGVDRAVGADRASETDPAHGTVAPGEGAGVVRAEADTLPGAGRGVQALTREEFSVTEAIGGVRGLVESVLPGLVFVLVYVLVRELGPALVAAGGVTLVAVLVRLVQRTPLTQALSGVVGVGIGAIWALRTGEAQDFYAWGLWVNAAWALGTAVSVLVGWPVVGVIVSLLRGQDMSWRRGADAAPLRRRYVWATWLWFAMFVARLAVQLPFFLAGEDAVGRLGVARAAMGVPLFALVLWLTWLMVGPRAGRAARSGPPTAR